MPSTEVISIGHEPDPAKRIRQRQGRTLRNIRTLKQLSRQEIADALGVTTGSVSHWENGRITPRQGHQIALARILDVPHSAIFGLDAEAVA